MTLNTVAKDWLATNAGTGTCFENGNKQYTDADGVSHVGRTGDVANAFYTAHQVAKDSVVIIAGTNYTAFRAINGNADLDMTDVGWVYANDGGTGSTATYCKATGCIPVWTCNTPMDGTESDGCGNTRANSACNAASVWTCNTPMDGYEHDQYGNLRANSACAAVCTPRWACNIPFDGTESDGCGNTRTNASCTATQQGTLNISSIPSYAYIVIDGVDTGKVTPTILSMTPGYHTIKLVMDGYDDLIEQVYFYSNQQIIKIYTLTAKAKTSSSDILLPAIIGIGVLTLFLKK